MKLAPILTHEERARRAMDVLYHKHRRVAPVTTTMYEYGVPAVMQELRLLALEKDQEREALQLAYDRLGEAYQALRDRPCVHDLAREWSKNLGGDDEQDALDARVGKSPGESVGHGGELAGGGAASATAPGSAGDPAGHEAPAVDPDRPQGLGAGAQGA